MYKWCQLILDDLEKSDELNCKNLTFKLFNNKYFSTYSLPTSIGSINYSKSYPVGIEIELMHIEEDRIIRLNLKNWLNLLEFRLSELQAILVKSYDFSKFKDFAVIINQAALIYAYTGFLDHSKQLCEKAILFFNHQSKKLNNVAILQFILQPWINLGRLLRITGNTKEALACFAFDIKPYDSIEHRVVCSVEKLGKYTINGSETYHSQRFLSLYETLKTHIFLGNFEVLLHNSQYKSPISENYLLNNLLIESKLIAAFYLNNIEEYIGYLNQLINKKNLINYHAVFYRLLEYFLLFENDKCFELLNDFQAYCIAICSDCRNKPAHIHFAFKYAQLLQKTHQREKCEEILNKVIEAYFLKKEEYGLIKALCMLEELAGLNNYHKNIKLNVCNYTDYLPFKKVLGKNECKEFISIMENFDKILSQILMDI
ncbi:MAG: hypothetical protein Tsb005_21510 [Gammaproteobacteria bacterium]